MRPRSFRRSHLGIAGLVAFSLIGVILANTSAAPPVAAEPSLEPQFFSWDGDPFGDGLNHYLLTIDSEPTADAAGWLQVGADDLLVAADTPPSRVAPEDIDAVVAAVDTSPTAEEVVDSIAAHPDVQSIQLVAFDIYAVTGPIGVDALAGIAGVATVAVDPSLAAATVDPYYPTQWGLDNDGRSTDPWQVTDDADIDAPEGWHRTRGAGVVVAVIDSGVDVSHPDLAANIWTNPNEVCGNGLDDDSNGYVDDCGGWDFANDVPAVTDYVGHGTHVAGIIAAEADNGIGIAGVAYEAKVMALKIGDGTPSLSAGLEAISYAIDNGARVINASWVVDDPSAAPFLNTAIEAAADAGILFVAAAGNEPVNIDASPLYPAASPLDNVITVAASTPSDTPAAWSAYGATAVDIYAPGEYIISTVPGGYGIYSGTSMAAPMVSAAAALLWAATPEATAAEVKGALLDLSDGPNDGITAFRDLATSDGRLNIDRAIYSAPLFQPSVMYNFHDFNSFEPDVAHNVMITAKTVDPWIGPPQIPAMYRAGLYVPVDGQPMAVVGQEITYTGAADDLTVVTDGTGRALVGTEFEHEERPAFVQAGDFTTLTMQLPAGTYAFVMEIVDVTTPGALVTMGDPAAVFFMVDPDGSITEMPQIPIGGDPAPATTTAAPATTAPPASSTPPTTGTTPTTISTTTVAPLPTTTTSAPHTNTTGAPTPQTTTGPAATTTLPPAGTTTTTLAVTTTTGAPLQTTTTGGPVGTLPTTTTTTTTTTAPTGLVITSINPASGPVAGHTLVTITGRNLPELPEVSFGDRTAEIVSVVAPTFIVVDTPPGNPGWVDVTITDRATGNSAVLVNAFAYTEVGEAPPPTTTTVVPPSTTIGVTTTTGVVPTTQPTATTGPPPPTTAPPVAPLPDLRDWRDSLLQTPAGLTLAPPAADDPINSIPVDLWIGALCDDPVCPGWVLED